MTIRLINILMVCIALAPLRSHACTSLVASPAATVSGKAMLWKHRDTSASGNFIERINPRHAGEIPYVALFNDGDSLLAEAWAGMNGEGFAVMNTASYNLAPDTARIRDREGIVMARALAVCRTVDDFRNLLDSLPRPMGVQANFGVIDAAGNAAYFETNDNGYTRYSIGGEGNAPALIRTNFSVSGNDSTGMGYIRYKNAGHLLQSHIDGRRLTPALCVDTVSCSFYHSMYGCDILSDTTAHWAVDQDFIPRYSSTASIAVEGNVMTVKLGYPPVARTYKVTIDSIPEEVRPLLSGFRSVAGARSAELKNLAFPIKRGSGQRYIDLDYLRKNIN